MSSLLVALIVIVIVIAIPFHLCRRFGDRFHRISAWGSDNASISCFSHEFLTLITLGRHRLTCRLHLTLPVVFFRLLLAAFRMNVNIYLWSSRPEHALPVILN
jgi:hypothetical protein